MRIMPSATRLMQCSLLRDAHLSFSLSLFLTLSLSHSLSPTLQEHLKCATPAKIAQPSKESGRGTSGAIIGRFFRNFSVSVGRVVYETSKDALFQTVDQYRSVAGRLVFSFRVAWEGVFILSICLFVRNVTDTQCTVLFPQCCRVTFDPCSNVSSCVIQPNFLPLPFLHY